MTLPKITIASRDRALQVYAEHKFVISISGSNEEPPAFNHPDVLFLHFDDISDILHAGFVPMRIAQFAELSVFACKIAADPGPVLVHCEQGRSRSSAIAISLANILAGPGHEEEIFGQLKAKFPRIKPNKRVIAIADSILERNGKISRSIR